MSQQERDKHDLQARPWVASEAIVELLSAARRGHDTDGDGHEGEPGGPAWPWPESRDGFWAEIGVPPDAPEGTAVSDGYRYSWFELIPDEPVPGTVLGFRWQEGLRAGVLDAVELNLATDVAEGTRVWMRWSEFDAGGGPGWAYLAPVAPGTDPEGSGPPPDPPPDCSHYEYEDDCIEGRLVRLKRLVWSRRGCLKAGPWRVDAVLGACGGDPVPAAPPCFAPGYRYLCVPNPAGSGPAVEREYVTRYYIRDGCLTHSGFVASRYTGKCCDCPASPPSCPPCPVDTACCPAVACALCVRFDGPGLCVPVQATLTYSTTPAGTGEPLCGWSGSVVLGSCAVALFLVCRPSTGAAPARWELALSGDLSAVLTLRNASCDPLALSDGLVVPPGLCCGDAGGVVNVLITAAPCDAACVPASACPFCPSGAPLTFTADLTWLSGELTGWDSLAAVVTLTWQGGCTWLYTTADGFSAQLYYSDGWLFFIQDDTGTTFQAEAGAGLLPDPAAFTCCGGGTFTGCYRPAGPACDYVRNNWDFNDQALVPGGSCCGGGGLIVTGCCPGGTPSVLYATFGGALAALGTVTIAWDAAQGKWVGAFGGCGGGTVKFFCAAGPAWTVEVTGSPGGGSPTFTCDPFFWTLSSVVSGTCSGAYSVTVTAVHP